jgi:predicted phosphodiesterase
MVRATSQPTARPRPADDARATRGRPEAPTRYALLSDIHANGPALAAVLDDVARRPGVIAYHLGDLVGYGAWPGEVVDALATARIPGVAGNYDSTIATGFPHCDLPADSPWEEELARRGYAWTRAHVSARVKRYLGRLPSRIDLTPFGGHVAGPTVTLVHATPADNVTYVTKSHPDAFLRRLGRQAGLRPGDVLCFGHTHQWWHRQVGGVHFVNTGSVGRPKDGDWRAGYVLLEVGAAGIHVDYVLVPYDVAAAARGVVAAGLPPEFARFLQTGGRRPVRRA